ncbi:MAG: glycerophosphodiester phosphodiesterase [Cyanobacteria bacterium]|nr:glycerophosphodiester phosphodiesterase [Cyanobacteriota bacterium]
MAPPVFASNRPLIFAHRGGAKLAPENTIAALDNGMRLGSDGFEIDVQLSADGIPVVIHDHTLDRTTDRTGPVNALTADELARVDAGYRLEIDGRHPFRGQAIGIPRLDDVLKRYPDARVIVEMKGAQPELARAVAASIRKADAVERICVGTFYQESMNAIRAAAPEIVTSASTSEARWTLHRSWVRWPWVSKQPYFAFQVPEFAGRMRVVSPAFVRQVHKQGQVMQVWVVNERDDIRRLLEWGVDGIISDRPDIAIATRDEWCTRT